MVHSKKQRLFVGIKRTFVCKRPHYNSVKVYFTVLTALTVNAQAFSIPLTALPEVNKE